MSPTWLILCIAVLGLCQANVIFHFALDFHVKQPENSTEPIDKTILVDHNQVFIQDSKVNSSWLEQDRYTEEALHLLMDTKRVVQQLNVELSPLVGRSNDLAARLKQTMRYANDVDACLENGHLGQQVEQLRKYVALVDALKLPSSTAGSRTLEFVVLKLALEKYQLPAKQLQVADYLQRADAAWTTYKNTQVVLAES
ncbi:hypothetical protein AWZ03_011406 [Drosophila navojoa]|uniref:Prolyl 4-hydroxylase alpha-subunit N-terminal domain-containing protein n=1 Tax=Drosophila navojoa TaxID=7232 RepID=A0A484B0E5_DRONA|nr:uncharacterized protein LOC115564138 [Drosophila navojoa]TDG42178.1 hypothetical protein AWZ03_011406 [Drosophila navojoa]